MEMLSNAVLGELVGRSISFLLSKCKRRMATAAEDDNNLQQLRHLLLRSGTIIEEADRRHVANQAMLRQLQAPRDEMFWGHYVADTVVSSRPLFQGEEGDDDEARGEETSRSAFSLSRFNPAKRVRFHSGDLRTAAELIGGGAASPRELQQMVRRLETMIGNMKEFLLFLASYPPLHRQPYSAHLFMDKCMFGRHMEREMVLDFLLNSEPPVAGKSNLGVLPIVGPTHIGKSTLVDHVCQDERVRNHFSSILVYNGNDLED